MFWRRKDYETLAEQGVVDDIVTRWIRACEGAGLARLVQTVSGPTVIPPAVTFVQLGPPVVLTVRLQPGQTVQDIRDIGSRLAPHLGCAAIRVESRGHGEFALVRLLQEDPLSGTVPMTYAENGAVLLGRTEDGRDLTQNLRDEAHMIVQGVTRSGKSMFTYGLLAALSRMPDVRLAGIDPTGLLWRPFEGSRHEEYQVSGLGRLDRHERLLNRLVVEMDQRIEKIPPHQDTSPITEQDPMVVVVLEEYAGLLRAVDGADKEQGKRIRSYIGRLLAEGAKVGIRTIILVQRAEANLIGGFERAMCSTRISFRCDNRASVQLLHPGAAAEMADEHTTSEPGVALVSFPGHPLTRIRAPYMAYGDYVSGVL